MYRINAPLKLNLGCGEVLYPGWLNVDIAGDADVLLDITAGLPFDDCSVDFIYSEHLVEHLPVRIDADGIESKLTGLSAMLGEAFRVLKPGAFMRTACPDLDWLVDRYLGDWRDQEWLRLDGYDFIDSRSLMLNVAMSTGGHTYLFNFEDLEAALRGAGFAAIEQVPLNVSVYAELRGLETRADSRLVVECVKPGGANL
jgi:predicted SAM-dependent methyltransferase